MAESVSTPYTIVTTKGKTKLTGITRVIYSDITDPQNKQINNPVTVYYTEVSADEYLTLPNDKNRFETSVSGVPGSFKFYKAVTLYRHDTGKFEETISTGADLKNEIGLFNAGKPNQLNTVIAAGNKAVSKQENIPLDQLNIKNTQAVKPPPQPPVPQPDPDIVARDTQTIAARDAVESAQPINISIPSENVRMDYDPPLFYPQELESNKQDRITFTMKRLTGSTINPNSFESNVRTIDRRNLEEIKGSVTLPIQPSISDNNSVDWSGGTLNAIQAYGAAASMKIIGSDDAVQLGDNVSRIMGVIARELTTKGLYQDAFKTFFAQEAVGTQNLLSRATGAILNPNLELLFNGPSLRPFAFTFRMSPRDPKEAEQVRKIIRFFKQGMSVKATPSNVFLQSPNIFAIRYQHWDGERFSEHPSINRIKKCALISCDVDYTPDGTYMTYNDERKTMTSYQLSLRFSELEPIYEDDYGGASGKTSTTAGRPLANDEIGY
jgi:hypothetical protein